MSAQAKREQAWARIVSQAREVNLVAFADKGVAVLDRSRCGDDAGHRGPSEIQRESRCRVALVSRFAARSVRVIRPQGGEL